MDGFQRYAVYFAPRPDSALGRFGAAWLGWDAERGVATDGLALDGLPLPRAELVATPRRYGFHATLKAPFRLAPGAVVADLDGAVRDLAAAHAPFDMRLRIDDATGFVALLLAGEDARVTDLAAACVTRLDGFRAALTPAEVAKRLAGGLDARRAAHLRRWGYPYVLDAFVFHLTLSGALPPAVRGATRAVLAEALAKVLEGPVAFEDLCLFGEAADGRFHRVARHALGLTASPCA